jgi:signal transduction histidine kinase/ActR/RegA family two-component response regulator/PAS domain-containing protein
LPAEESRTDDEDTQLRSVAIQNAQSILSARQRADERLLRAKDELEQKSVELAASLAMMRATLEATTDGILVTDSAGRVKGYNQRLLQMWRLPEASVHEGEHRQVLEACSAGFADPEVFVRRAEEIHGGALPESFDVLRLTDGRVFERSSQIQFVEQRIAGRVWSFRDITDRRRVEEALREETRVLELLNTTGSAIASQLDLQQLVQAVTDSATQLSGAQFGAFFYNTQDENGDALLLYTLSGAPREAFDKFGHPRATPLFGPTFRGEPVIRCDDVLADPRYGKMKPTGGMPPNHLPVRSYLAVSVVSRTGEVIGGLFFGHPECGVFTERTERVIVGVAAQTAVAIDNARLYERAKRATAERERLLEAERYARAEAERVSRLKDEFLATLSHELRTPLNAVLGWSQIIKQPGVSSTDVSQGLEVIERNARAQAQIIEDLLDMSRIISGKVRLDVQRLDLSAIVAAAIETARPTAEAKGIRLLSVIDPLPGAPVGGDANRLQQVLWNLLSNAIKFTPKGGRVQVLLERVNSHVEISVIDTGEGMKPEFLPFVFDRFRQADASTTRRHGGLGLGLSIVKQLVELHGGTVVVKSEGPGKGTTFVVTLPIVSVHQAGSETDDRRHPRVAQQHVGIADSCLEVDGLRVLVVDDEPDARNLVKRVLEDCHAVVTATGSVDEAVRLVESERFDVLVSDIGMPGQDGYALIRRVRALPAAGGGRIPGIALTAYARADDRVKAIAAGFVMHLAKPIEPAELVTMVAAAAGRAGRPADEPRN